MLRSFLGTHEFPFASPGGESLIASTSHIEAAALMILTGEYIGFLPLHFAKQWLDTGELAVLLPDRLYRKTQFSIATRSDQLRPPPALQAFVGCLRAEMKHTSSSESVQYAPASMAL